MPRSSGATELMVMVSGGFRSTYEAVLPGLTEATGHVARMLPSPSMGDTPDAIPNRLARGEPCDVLIMVGSALDALIKQGLAQSDTKADVALSPIGVAVRAGAPVPTIGTSDQLRAALLAAGSVAYSDSASGAYVEGTLFRKLGIAEQMRGKAHRIAATPVGEVVAAGRAEIGFQEVAELLPVKGIAFAGKLPASLELLTVYSAAVATRSKSPQAALQLIRFISRPELDLTLKRMGLEPPRR